MRIQAVDSKNEILLLESLTSLAHRFKSPFQDHRIREGGSGAEKSRHGHEVGRRGNAAIPQTHQNVLDAPSSQATAVIKGMLHSGSTVDTGACDDQFRVHLLLARFRYRNVASRQSCDCSIGFESFDRFSDIDIIRGWQEDNRLPDDRRRFMGRGWRLRLPHVSGSGSPFPPLLQ